MSNFIKKLYYSWRSYKLRQEAKAKLKEKIFTSPLVYVRATREIDCAINGHKWSSEFDPKKNIDKKFKERIYCKHCGVYHHEHNYNENVLKTI